MTSSEPSWSEYVTTSVVTPLTWRDMAVTVHPSHPPQTMSSVEPFEDHDVVEDVATTNVVDDYVVVAVANIDFFLRGFVELVHNGKLQMFTDLMYPEEHLRPRPGVIEIEFATMKHDALSWIGNRQMPKRYEFIRSVRELGEALGREEYQQRMAAKAATAATQ